jgi:hypothetical protein
MEYSAALSVGATHESPIWATHGPSGQWHGHDGHPETLTNNACFAPPDLSKLILYLAEEDPSGAMPVKSLECNGSNSNS